MAYNRETHIKKGREVKIALAEKGMFQGDAAARLGMSPQLFTMKLVGNRSFTNEEKRRLSKLLDKPVDELFPSQDTECLMDSQEQSPLAAAGS